ncbi:uncharacterized protein [Nicotiana tomentosiformis]|uniref:uncharacterized protein n=1 Tax=Nicotiana tomentosiformis TaxID=4098 RepID=UPI00388CD663
MFVGIISRLISDVWYSILINGTRQGFFHSTRGLKQGDPLSPTLFILAAETLTKALNILHDRECYIGFSIDQNGPQINHLYYAYDLVIFSSGNKRSIKMTLNALHNYEEASGQEISKEKSFFVTVAQTPKPKRRMIEIVTGYKHQHFPFKYLGCPIYCGRKIIFYFNDMVTKILQFQSKPRHLILDDCITDEGTWDLDFISQLVPADILDKISKIPISDRRETYIAIWTPSTDGRFNCSTAFEIVRQRKDQLEETINHLFLESDTAKAVWNLFYTNLGLTPHTPSLSGRLFTWITINTHNKFIRTMHQIIPIYICWEIWKARCASRYGNGAPPIYKIFQEILFHIKIYLNKIGARVDLRWNWYNLCTQLDNLRPSLIFTPVTWGKPPNNWIKINTDGRSNSEDLLAGIGGIVRDKNGSLVMAFAKKLYFCTNNTAELSATFFAISWCIANNYMNIILDLDSLLVVNIIQEYSSIP